MIANSVGATGRLEFPHGKQKCTVLVTTKCGGPSFMVNTASSVAANDYEVYWTEWDTGLIDKAVAYIDELPEIAPISSSMAPFKRWPPLNQKFEYTGLGSKYTPGYPGTDGMCTNYLSFNCYKSSPDSGQDLTRLRGLKYGLGKPTTGQYDVSLGGWHAFGGQG